MKRDLEDYLGAAMLFFIGLILAAIATVAVSLAYTAARWAFSGVNPLC